MVHRLPGFRKGIKAEGKVVDKARDGTEKRNRFCSFIYGMLREDYANMN